jgi:SAM-dependent methyltransferase
MLHQIRNIVEVHPDYGKRPLQVVDVGGGKGHLANFLAHHFGPEVVQVQVVDISPSAVQNGLMRARRHQLANIQYNVGDATIAQFEQGVDVVVALHACGALSDVALGHAVTSGASFAICPCCFRSNPQLRVKVPTTTITTTQSSVSALSNNNNNNRLVTVAEWLNVAGKEEEQQFENLKSLAEVQGDMDTAAQAIHSVCALRADAVMRHHPATSDYETKNKIQVELKTFPVSFSTRNFCIIGTVSSKGDTLVEIL